MPRLHTAIAVAVLLALISCVLAATGGSAPGASTVVAKVEVGGEPCGVVGTPDGIWVADYGGNRIVHIDPATATVVGQVRGIRSVCELTYARGALWAPSRTGVLYRVDPTGARSRPASPFTASSSTWSQRPARYGSSRTAGAR